MANERREFARNYEGCFISLPLNSGLRRAFIVKGEDGANVLGATVSLTYRETAKQTLYEDVMLNWSPIIPSAGYFNVLPDPATPWYTAMYVKVRPDRQFRKGLPADTKIVSASVSSSPYYSERWNALLEGSNGEYTFPNKVLATHLAQGKGRGLVSLRQAADMVNSGHHHSVAFAKSFCMSLRNSLKYPCILYAGELAGVYADETVWALDSILHLKDFFEKRWNVAVRNITEYGKV